MEHLLSERIKRVPESFIRKILKVSTQPDVISFAGGLPNADFFPVEAIKQACNSVLEAEGKKVLQYAASEGDEGLRNWIANRYQEKQGVTIAADNILITNGSQQALDLIAKVLLNDDDCIAIENPGYLGAIQSFALYYPEMYGIPLNADGMDTALLQDVIKSHKPKLLYTVPNFQNPTGITYSESNRKSIANIIRQSDVLLIQDDPYGELDFSASHKTSFYELLPEQTLLLGSFSKVVTPSFRLGWIVAPDWLIKPLTIAKQAADLHTNYFSQRVLVQYLKDNDLDEHIKTITAFYAKQKTVMMEAIKTYFPTTVEVKEVQGGMFIWAKLPENLSAMALFDVAIKEKVAFVPGKPFYVGDECKDNTLRLSFVTVDAQNIEQGIKKLGLCIKNMLE